MTILSVCTYPDSVLHKKAEPCDLSDPSLKKLAKDMLETMYHFKGCGLAAPQVGISKRLVVMDVEQDENGKNGDPLILINPEIVNRSGALECNEEGCLSCPGILVPVYRRPFAKVQFYDVEGDLWEIEGDGLLGRCLQHEIDHLDGKTLFESTTPQGRMQALEDYQEARKAGARPGQTTVKK